MSPKRMSCLGSETSLRQLLSLVWQKKFDLGHFVEVLGQLADHEISVTKALEEIVSQS